MRSRYHAGQNVYLEVNFIITQNLTVLIYSEIWFIASQALLEFRLSLHLISMVFA
jgi:hypothetical protein